MKILNKIPLTLLVVSQSFNVGLWNYFELRKKLPESLDWLAITVSAIMGLAMDLAIVSVALGKSKKTVASWSTLVVMFVGTSAIALALYSWDWLHVFYGASVLGYSLHLLFGSLPDATANASGATAKPSDSLEPYSCPHCNATLKNKQALASAKTLGYCKACKEKV